MVTLIISSIGISYCSRSTQFFDAKLNYFDNTGQLLIRNKTLQSKIDEFYEGYYLQMRPVNYGGFFLENGCRLFPEGSFNGQRFSQPCVQIELQQRNNTLTYKLRGYRHKFTFFDKNAKNSSFSPPYGIFK